MTDSLRVSLKRSTLERLHALSGRYLTEDVNELIICALTEREAFERCVAQKPHDPGNQPLHVIPKQPGDLAELAALLE